MKRKSILAGVLTLVLLLSACGGGSRDSMPAGSAPSASSGDMEMGFNDQAYRPEEPRDESGETVYRDPDAKLIRRAQIHIQTEGFDRAVQALEQMVEQAGGYFENAVVYGGSYRDQNARRSGEYVVRIPSQRYESFLEQTGDLGYVTSSDESSENVGERYHDTEARLKTQRTKQERLLALLERAETMEDIIALENALSEVEYQIEQMSSTLNRYDALIDFSTFTIFLEEVSKVSPEVGQAASLGQRMGAGIKASLSGLVDGVQELLVWASYHLFGLLLAGGLAAAFGVAIFREVKKRKRDGENGG